jgi:hybrid polyketide synthase / nonribosomal peptide synthetase ACE1
VQIQGLHAVPLAPAKPEEDCPLFSRFDYRIDQPNGDVAAVNDPPVREVTEAIIESDRLAFYYLRHLVETITPEEKANTLPHYQHVINWADHIVEGVKSGKNSYLPPDCMEDTKDRFKTFIDEYASRTWPVAEMIINT